MRLRSLARPRTPSALFVRSAAWPAPALRVGRRCVCACVRRGMWAQQMETRHMDSHSTIDRHLSRLQLPPLASPASTTLAAPRLATPARLDVRAQRATARWSRPGGERAQAHAHAHNTTLAEAGKPSAPPDDARRPPCRRGLLDPCSEAIVERLSKRRLAHLLGRSRVLGAQVRRSRSNEAHEPLLAAPSFKPKDPESR